VHANEHGLKFPLALHLPWHLIQLGWVCSTNSLCLI
jgi:hypothetical protein